MALAALAALAFRPPGGVEEGDTARALRCLRCLPPPPLFPGRGLSWKQSLILIRAASGQAVAPLPASLPLARVRARGPLLEGDGGMPRQGVGRPVPVTGGMGSASGWSREGKSVALLAARRLGPGPV